MSITTCHRCRRIIDTDYEQTWTFHGTYAPAGYAEQDWEEEVCEACLTVEEQEAILEEMDNEQS